MHCTTKTLLGSVFNAPKTLATTATLPPSFLIPAFSAAQTSSFSTTTAQSARKDGNKLRGISALYRSGLNKRIKLTIKPSELPRPVLDPAKRSQVQVDEDHGLWEFFPEDRKTMATPEEMGSHGREWTTQELRHKDWDDLHRLWWVCVKERNRLLTYAHERNRIGKMYGDYEQEERTKAIKMTMKAIKFVLTERWYTWENARVAAMEDEEINMYADLDAGDIAYMPKEDSFEPEPNFDADSAAAQVNVQPPPGPPTPQVKI